MARDPYDQDDEDRAAPKGQTAKSISVSQNIGPLPVWGWGAVLVAAVFLWRRIGGGASAQQAGAATGMTAPAYTPATGGVYLLPNGTGSTPQPAPSYLPTYPVGVPGTQQPTGQQCPPGYVWVQGASGGVCATGQQAVDLGRYLQAVGSSAPSATAAKK